MSTKVVTRAVSPFLLSLCKRVKNRDFTCCAARVARALLSSLCKQEGRGQKAKVATRFHQQGGQDNDDFQENTQNKRGSGPLFSNHDFDSRPIRSRTSALRSDQRISPHHTR